MVLGQYSDRRSLKEQMERINKERLHQLEIATTLNRCAAELSADRNTGVAIYNLLGIICNYFQADRSYIFDIDYENGSLLIHTNMQQRVFPVRSIISRKSPSVIEVWLDRFEKGEVYYIADTKQEKGIPLTKCWVEQKVQRLLTVPLKKMKKIIGFVGVDNPGLILMMPLFCCLCSILL